MSLLPLTDKLDLDEVLVKYKIYHRYHKVSCALITLVMICNSVGFYNYIFVNEAVGYRCADSRLESENAKNSLNMSETNYTQKNAATWCENPVSCPEWVYDEPDSFMAEFQLACQDWKRTLVGSVRGFGNMVGLIIVGPLSDRIGRKASTIVTVIANAVLGTSKSFVTLYWLYIALDFLEAAIGDCSSPLFMLGLEMVATRYRVTYTTMCNMAFGLGGLLLPLMAWLVPNWRTLLRVAHAPGLLLVPLIYSLDESPRWLLANGKKAAAVKILRNAAKRNKLKIEDKLNAISYVKKGAELSFVRVISDTFKSRSLLKRFFVSTTWWIACTFVNQGLSINSVTLVGNKYVNYALTAASKILSSFLFFYTVNKFNRKGSLILSFVVCAILCTGQSMVPKKFPWLLVLTYMLGKFTSSMCLSITYLFTSELFPTHTRNSMQGLCSSIGRIGSIIAPQTPLLMVYWSGLPTMTFGAVSLTAGLLTLLVPDTSDQNLPDTVCQAESLGQAKS